MDAVRPYVFQHSSRDLPKPAHVFNHEIVCFCLEDVELSVGDRILARCPDGRMLDGAILGMEVDHVAVDHVSAPPKVSVGCRVGFRARKTYSYVVVT